jgi:hypothetical protein
MSSDRWTEIPGGLDPAIGASSAVLGKENIIYISVAHQQRSTIARFGITNSEYATYRLPTQYNMGQAKFGLGLTDHGTLILLGTQKVSEMNVVLSTDVNAIKVYPNLTRQLSNDDETQWLRGHVAFFESWWYYLTQGGVVIAFSLPTRTIQDDVVLS